MLPETEDDAPAPPAPPLPAARRWLLVCGGLLAVYLAATASWRKALPEWWSGRSIKLPDVVHGACWWGGLGALGLLTALYLSSGKWARIWPAPSPSPSALPAARAPRWLVVTLLLAMMGGAALRAPRLGLSLYNDECHVFRAQLCGSVPKAHLGNAEKFRQLKWISTLYENRGGNNAMPFSILARSSYEIWRKISGAKAGVVNETALRLPVMICGVLAIGALGWLGWRLNGPATGAAAALLAALHPWHMRYSAEARPHGLLLVILPLLFLALHRAWGSGRWRDWLVFGLLEYLTVACFMAAVHFMIALNAFIFAGALIPAFRAGRGLFRQRISWPLLVPATVAGVLAAALFLTVNFPLYVQLAKVLTDPGFFHSPHPFDAAWFRDVGSFLSLGMPVARPTPSAVQPSLASLWEMPGLTGILPAAGLSGLAVLLAAGLWRLCSRPGTGRMLCLANLGGAALTLLYCQAKGLMFLKWYTLFLLPGILLAAAAGLAALSGGRRPWGGLLVLPLVLCWLPALSHYRRHSREDLRGVLEAARGTPYPEALKNSRNSLFAVSWSESPVYEPSAATLRTGAELDSLIRTARAEKRELFVEFGFRNQARENAPEVVARLENPQLFEEAGIFPGLDEEESFHYLYRLKPFQIPR